MSNRKYVRTGADWGQFWTGVGDLTPGAQIMVPKSGERAKKMVSVHLCPVRMATSKPLALERIGKTYYVTHL